MTREAEWDDYERAKMQGLAIYESQMCDCGLHESVAKTDPDIDIELPVCPVCAGYTRQMRVLHAEDDREISGQGDHPRPGAPRRSDGRSVRMHVKQPTDT